MSAAEPLLQITDMTAGYAEGAVVHGASLEVGAGEVVALLGANGAGKTTTILVAAGFLTPTSGTIRILGEEEPARRRPSAGAVVRRARRGMGVVLDDRALFADLTVAENLRLGRPRRRDDALPDELLHEWFPALEALHGRRAGLLSGGEQQMLALARALVSRPRLLLIDELSMGLAPMVAAQLLEVVRRIATDTATGVLLVEQHVHLALGVADRGYLLQRGRVVLEGTAAELEERRAEVETGYLGG